MRVTITHRIVNQHSYRIQAIKLENTNKLELFKLDRCVRAVLQLIIVLHNNRLPD